MTQTVSGLILRVRDIVKQNRDWFEAVAAWYDCARWTKRIFLDYLAVRDRPICRASLTLNSQLVTEGCRESNTPEALPVWWIPGFQFRTGDNLLVLRIEPAGADPVQIDGITVEHLPELVEQTKRDVRIRPRATTQAAVAVCLGAGYQPGSDRWHVQTQPHAVQFSLRFEDHVPSRFLLGVAVKLPTVGYSLILEDIWDFVEDAIKDKIKELIKDYYRRLQANDPRAQLIEQQLRDLESYLELHQTHMAQMLSARDETTLDEIIEKTRKRKPIESSTSSKKEPPIQVEPIQVKPIRVEPIPQKAPPAPGMHWFARLLVLMVLLGVTGGVILWSAWYIGVLRVNDFPAMAQIFDGKKGPKGRLRGPNVGNPARITPEAPAAPLREDFLQRLVQQKAQTGDVQVSLFWSNKNDLDLEVIGPGGKIDFTTRGRFVGGGTIDVDRNVFYPKATTRPLENIHWPTGAAPKGHYKIFVHHFNNHGQPDCQDPTRFSVRVLVNGNERWFAGELTHQAFGNDDDRNRVLVHEFDLR